MEFRRIPAAELTDLLLDRMTDLERRCGLEPYTREMLRDCVENLDTWGAFDGSLLAGFATISWTRAYCDGSLYIANLNVAPEYRGKGIAKLLLYAVTQELVCWFPGRMVSLDVMRSNRAKNLYEKIGFTIQDTPSRNGPEDVVMAVLLDDLVANLKGYVEKKKW